MPRATCKDCGKAFAAKGPNVVVCPACVNKRLGKPAPKARTPRPKNVPTEAPAAPVPVPAPAPDAALMVLRAELGEAKAALDAQAAELAQAKADLMDANAEAARLWREKRVVEEQLRKALLRLKMIKGQEVAK